MSAGDHPGGERGEFESEAHCDAPRETVESPDVTEQEEVAGREEAGGP